MKKITKETKKILDLNWRIRMSFYAEANKLYAEANKLYAEANKLWAEGNKLWAETILAFCGNIKLEWKNWDDKNKSHECHLEDVRGGIVFTPPQRTEG